MSEQPVIFEERPSGGGKRLGIVTLNAPRSLNALSQVIIHRLREQLAAWRVNDAIAGVVLAGTGEKAFCAGGDVVRVYHAIREHPGGPNPVAEAFFESEYRLDYQIHTYPKPILCWGHGIVMGGGLGLMAGADHRVVTETSSIAMPEITIGLYPDVGGTWFLNRMPGRVGLYLELTGTSINASDALFVNLADYCIAVEHFKAMLDEVIGIDWGDDAERNRGRLSLVLRRFADQSRDAMPESGLRRHLDFINHITDYHSVIEIHAALQAADIADPWIRQGAQNLAQGSPTSAHVIFEQYRRGKHLSLKEVFMREFFMSVQFTRHPDFAEGVRALLVDKDRNPHWTPPRLEDVTPEWVEEHFAVPGGYGRNPLEDL